MTSSRRAELISKRRAMLDRILADSIRAAEASRITLTCGAMLLGSYPLGDLDKALEDLVQTAADPSSPLASAVKALATRLEMASR